VPRFADLQVDVIRLDMMRGDPRAVVTSRNMLPHERQLEIVVEPVELEGERGLASEPEDETHH
jgi:hypothetical protein